MVWTQGVLVGRKRGRQRKEGITARRMSHLGFVIGGYRFEGWDSQRVPKMGKLKVSVIRKIQKFSKI